ncbi:MAG: low molecular weight phosphotyrosine protein phosphatase [Campylobacterales bacterium]|nr:low molecular weight phosphotyrosine protein phosphatase [Campylobacterales bacterium]
MHKPCVSLLFVCLGNICRSPLAEGIAKHKALQMGLHVAIDSAGTGHWHIGEAPCERSIEIARINGVDISSLRARQVNKADFAHFDYIIALDTNNYNDLKTAGATKLFKLGDFGYNGKDIPDPYFFSSFEGFDKVYRMIEECVESLLTNLICSNNIHSNSFK